jgi:hypothetical protein
MVAIKSTMPVWHIRRIKKMLMKLAAIPPSDEEVRVRQAEGVNIAHQLSAFRSWDGVFFGSMLGNPCAAKLQGIFALPTNQSRLRPIQVKPKFVQFVCKIFLVH